MITIKNDDAIKCVNSDKCETLEYSLKDKDIDLCVALITGRYPEKDYCLNLISKSLIYILEGTGKLYFENKTIEFSKGDSILIDSNEKYYWDTNYCKVSITCTPAWSKEQYKIVK